MQTAQPLTGLEWISPKGYNLRCCEIIYTLNGVILIRFTIFAPQRVYRMTQLAKYVKEMRKQFGLTQVDLSQKSGVGLRFVRELEQGKQTLRLDKVNQVLAMFGAEMTPTKKERESFYNDDFEEMIWKSRKIRK